MPLTRRSFIQMVPASAAALALTSGAKAAEPIHHVTVLGGGFAGCTVAKYLRMWSNGEIAVTLIEPNSNHVSCIMSNLILNKRLKTTDLTFEYNDLQVKYGVEVVHDRALRIRGPQKQLRLKNAGWVNYDSLVVATGIQFDKIPGLVPSKVPHAWIAGGQTNNLRNKIIRMPDTGTFVMTIPKAPYRCPPGPYERACIVADILGRRSGYLDGTGNVAPRVIVLDANPGIMAEKGTFTSAFNDLYGDIIEYIPDAQVESVDSDNLIVNTSQGSFAGDVLNVIPNHGAQNILKVSGLTGDSRWADVDPVTYASTNTLFQDVYVIGDTQGTSQPKSGHMANAQAKICADSIIRTAHGLSSYTEERLQNITTNSACFSPITYDEASWLTAVYSYNPDTGSMGLVPGSLGEAHNWSSRNFNDMFTWSDNLFADTFK
ncbi:FAD/NAD(P)-binding oxidoreductase [uncultured Amphritea sp.]|uniref:NAD(P)/FAD-dependent oxidoreductase n=1 Tax=uncultured Amphritea sp. TaxID=981605 RepID=UPI00260E22B7|nr:FAD/NAD(P)-binding oxidoreductase [uncultured Amphritea sp.]